MTKRDLTGAVTGILIMAAVVFGALGFVTAGDYRVAPAIVGVFWAVAVVCCVAITLIGRRQPRQSWMRTVGLIAAVAALYLVVVGAIIVRAISRPLTGP